MPDTLEPPPSTLFAHESEEKIARLLDFYGIPWQYEPRSFDLEWDDEGRPTQAFTPDFYLPDFDLYLEITTLKPSLMNRKLKKVRRLKERYPEVAAHLPGMSRPAPDTIAFSADTMPRAYTLVRLLYRYINPD